MAFGLELDDDRKQSHGNHSVTVGYSQDGEELKIHDTWDDDYHYLAWGSWLACMYTKVTKI